MKYREFYEISQETFEHFREKLITHAKGVPGWEHRDCHVAFLHEEDDTYSAVLVHISDEVLDSKLFRFYYL